MKYITRPTLRAAAFGECPLYGCSFGFIEHANVVNSRAAECEDFHRLDCEMSHSYCEMSHSFVAAPVSGTPLYDCSLWENVNANTPECVDARL